ncbi:DUF1778 domain-containing protein [Agrococcus sp. Ld7]|uniref:type II toxin-antitoxin system TacA family antitoxin n=1 Tax=Agrococcus sp. Ld7 TaxID=649148 RepID=UPI003868E29C
MSVAKERIEVRVDADLKESVDRAASIRGTTAAAFIKSTLRDAADQVIDSERRVALEEASWERVRAMLDEEPAPIPEMVELFRRKSVFEA